MPIPPFDGILNVLPPHLGAPGTVSDLSPYPCTAQELCQRLAATPARKKILNGLFDLRAELFGLGIQGFQWLDGSFVEDIEGQDARDPRDVDVVTFVSDPADPAALQLLLGTRPELLYRPHVKATYSVDHFWVPLGSVPARIVDLTRYWYGVFSHRRDRVWKGLLKIELRDKTDDDAARLVLGSMP